MKVRLSKITACLFILWTEQFLVQITQYNNMISCFGIVMLFMLSHLRGSIVERLWNTLRVYEISETKQSHDFLTNMKKSALSFGKIVWKDISKVGGPRGVAIFGNNRLIFATKISTVKVNNIIRWHDYLKCHLAIFPPTCNVQRTFNDKILCCLAYHSSRCAQNHILFMTHTKPNGL